MEKVAVYCGAAPGNHQVYQTAAEETGHWLVDHDLTLVYGGGRMGLMGLLAETVLADHGQVHGIITQELADRGTGAADLTELTVVPDMAARKVAMLTQADGCLALPGGPGTLEEISEAFSWALIGDNETPCVFYNVDHFYDPLETMYDQMVATGFLTASGRDKLLFATSLEEAWTFMKTYTPPAIRTYSH
ncbi:TIGR00730 family Rossman fold protein [Furfurilactobacillus sp. WILCCON 0119]